jgi:hypothetical protein
MLSPILGQPFYSNPIYQGPGSFGLDNSIDRARTRRVDSSVLQADNRKQYQLDLEKIRKGDDTRTTLMIKNIPNKYAIFRTIFPFGIFFSKLCPLSFSPLNPTDIPLRCFWLQSTSFTKELMIFSTCQLISRY